MSRRSVSSWDSPGPRVPIPPPVRERCVHRRVRRGSWYSSCASSTWSRPSWVWAWRAKMSRISRLRSMTLTLSRLSRLFCCAGLSSSSATRTSKPVSDLGLGQLLGLALAHVPVGVDVAAVLPLRAHDVGARRGRQRGELGQAVVGGPALVVAGVDGDEEGLLDGRGEVDGSGGGSWRRQDTGRGFGAPAGRRTRLEALDRGRSPGRRGVEDLEATLAAEPGPLAARELDVALRVERDRPPRAWPAPSITAQLSR